MILQTLLRRLEPLTFGQESIEAGTDQPASKQLTLSYNDVLTQTTVGPDHFHAYVVKIKQHLAHVVDPGDNPTVKIELFWQGQQLAVLDYVPLNPYYTKDIVEVLVGIVFNGALGWTMYTAIESNTLNNLYQSDTFIIQNLHGTTDVDPVMKLRVSRATGNTQDTNATISWRQALIESAPAIAGTSEAFPFGNQNAGGGGEG